MPPPTQGSLSPAQTAGSLQHPAPGSSFLLPPSFISLRPHPRPRVAPSHPQFPEEEAASFSLLELVSSPLCLNANILGWCLGGTRQEGLQNPK